MSNNLQNYAVNYTINVEASEGVKQVDAFARSVAQLTSARTNLTGAVTNIKKMMEDIDKAFRTKSGKKRDYSYKFNIDTSQTETKLDRVKILLTEIGQLSKGINLALNTGQPLNSKAVKANAKSLISKKVAENNEKTARETAESFSLAQQRITKNIGKINAALIHLEKGRQLNINTDVAKQRLNEVLGLIAKVQSSTVKGATLKLNTKGFKPGNLSYAPYNSSPVILSDKANQRIQEKIISARQLGKLKLEQQEAEASAKAQRKNAVDAAKRFEREQERIRKQQELIRKKAISDQVKAEKEEQRRQQINAANAVRQVQKQSSIDTSIYGGKRRAAVNRLQYSRTPSFRNMPFAYMFNAYMGYSLMKSELMQAVEYSNIMETAHSILKVADSDLSTFESRFDSMAKYVRQIGVETKFTAIEVAGAVKYLSMAGMGIETINESIRPITNLALIGDNDISLIADLATNIMAGYDIKSTSMGSVADILGSTVSRSNVNIIEMAESFKMSAGYLKMAGVDFTEAAAAIGLLGNAGIKGTMAGTSLRAMSTRFAKPTKESQKTMDRLGVKFTEYQNVYGKQVEKLKPLSEIFGDLKAKGATMADMQAIFGKIGGNAAMMLLKNVDTLQELTAQNRASQGISGELAKVKQDTTKGLWFQVSSQFSESFMQAFEILEPQIQSTLKSFLSKFSAPEFAKGLASIGSALLDIISILSNVATWFTKNFSWIEPLLFSGFVATRLFKLAGALTNVGVALGFIGKQSVASSGFQLISGLAGFGGFGGVKGMSMANKRAVVSALSAAGVSGKGAMAKALVSGGMTGGANALLARGAASGLFASQVATGNGLVGAGASLSALGSGAVAATAGVAALVGVMGWLAYKTWKVKEAKDAMLEDIESNRKYRYPSIDALHASLKDTYETAISAKKAVDDLTSNKTIEEASGHKIGAFTGNWWAGMLGSVFAGFGARNGDMSGYKNTYSTKDAYQDDARDALISLAKKDSQSRVNSALAELGKLRNSWEVDAFINNVFPKYGQDLQKLDYSLWTTDANGNIIYNKDILKLKENDAHKTWHYANYHNTETVQDIIRVATTYKKGINSYAGARELLEKGGFDFSELESKGFYLNKNGNWVQKALTGNITDADRSKQLENEEYIKHRLVKLTSSLRATYGSSEAAENILQKAGFSPRLYSNEPQFGDTEPFNANGITNNHLTDDDGRAGGNYSGTGKLKSVAPKQVIVNISNLLSVGTIDLLKSKEGQAEEIQNLKEQMAQALIDVVHDFDASWNG